MRRLGKSGGKARIILAPLLAFIAYCSGCASYTPAIAGANGKIVPGSIASLEKMKIGGLEQWLLIRGKSTANPVLLFIHGGPGSAESPLVCHYNKELEEYFTVVNWDQRGAGKSYSAGIPVETMTISQFISDAHEVVLYLREKFHKDKLFLMGHSWGSVLGIFIAREYPRFFHAYIGVGQVVNGKDNERLSFEFALETARKSGIQDAVRELNGLNEPEPYWMDAGNGDWFDKLRKQREWLLKLGGSVYKETNYDKWVNVFLSGPEYSICDCMNWIQGNIFSVKAMWPEIMQVDLFNQVPNLEVPVYFLAGRHDYQTPFELVERYFNQLDAPKKEIIWFDNSAHSPMYEEADKFNAVLIEKILKENGEADPPIGGFK